jgi:hypothetical protein
MLVEPNSRVFENLSLSSIRSMAVRPNAPPLISRCAHRLSMRSANGTGFVGSVNLSVTFFARSGDACERRGPSSRDKRAKPSYSRHRAGLTLALGLLARAAKVAWNVSRGYARSLPAPLDPSHPLYTSVTKPSGVSKSLRWMVGSVRAMCRIICRRHRPSTALPSPEDPTRRTDINFRATFLGVRGGIRPLLLMDDQKKEN